MAKEFKNFRRGDSRDVIIDYGTGVNITGYQFWLTLKVNFDDVSNVAQVKTTAGDHALDDVVNGKAVISLPSSVTKEIPVGKYLWDIQRVIPGSPPNVLTLLPSEKNLRDKIEVLPDVTIDDVI